MNMRKEMKLRRKEERNDKILEYFGFLKPDMLLSYFLVLVSLMIIFGILFKLESSVESVPKDDYITIIRK